MEKSAEQISPNHRVDSLRQSIWRPSSSALHDRLDLLQWLAPTTMIFLVVVYEILNGEWIYEGWAGYPQWIGEIVFFGLLGPALLYTLLFFLRRWLEEKETSDYQTQLLEQVREQIRNSQAATDDVLQAMFAASVFLAALETKDLEFSAEEILALRRTQEAFDQSIQKLRRYLDTEFF